MTDAATLGGRIHAARMRLVGRLQRKISQGEFGRLVAEQMGRAEPFGASAVSEWEHNRREPDLATLDVIARLAGVPRQWLAWGDDPPGPAPSRPDPRSVQPMPMAPVELSDVGRARIEKKQRDAGGPPVAKPNRRRRAR